jgi:hypothetical protein
MSYATITVKATRDAVLEALRAQAVTATVTTHGAYSVVVSQDVLASTLKDVWFSTPESPLPQLAQSLSSTLQAPALAVLNWDDDLLRFWAYQTGKLTSEYDSNPSYATCTITSPELSDAQALASTFGLEDRAFSIGKLLARRKGLGFISESGRLRQLLEALNLPLEAAAPTQVS